MSRCVLRYANEDLFSLFYNKCENNIGIKQRIDDLWSEIYYETLVF